MNWSPAEPHAVRSAIAGAWLGAHGRPTLGSVVLRPHQRDAAARLRTLIDAHGGAMLADPVGLGKTYTALAAARDARALVVVAPAALRPMWTEALAATGTRAEVFSYDALSRGLATLPVADVVVADEAHHVRNPATRRYRALARLSAAAKVLLLTATPVHNRIDDLRAQLALFLGERAWSMSEAELQRCIVKRSAADVTNTTGGSRLPTVASLRWLDVPDDAAVLDDLLRLPPPMTVEDGGDGGPLIALSLVRQWGSSRAALQAALRARLAQAESLLRAFEAGRHPTRQELRAWCYADGALQLAFPQLASDHPLRDPAACVHRVTSHMDHVRRLMRRLDQSVDADDARAAALLRVRRSHPGARIVVFAEFAATVHALYTRLVAHGGVAMLTHAGGVVPGGRMSRGETLARFAAPDAERGREITLLVSTDVLSEGVNLQQASVVVHADLPWSPARCEQRVGRVRRLNSPHAEVFVYALRPPASAERLLRVEQRLRQKVCAAARAVGVQGTIMPALFPEPAIEAPQAIDATNELAARLAAWLRPVDAPSAPPIVAAVRAPTTGFLALVRTEGHDRIVASHGASISDAPQDVLAMVRTADGPGLRADVADVRDALSRIDDWCGMRESLDLFESSVNAAGTARRRLIRRIESIASRVPRHLRGRYVPLARAARRAATLPFGAGAEQVLVELAEARMPDDAWLTAVRAFADLHARESGGAEGPAVIALLLLVPTSWPAAAPRR